MPQQSINKEFLTFVKGIITEANPLTFPQDASIDEQNFVLNRDGSRQRRLGIEYEDNFTLNDSGNDSTGFSTIGISSNTWKNINEDASLTFYVIQFGTSLFFFDANDSSPSSSIKNGGNAVVLEGELNSRWQVANLGGKLIVVTGATTIYSLEYDESSDTISTVFHGLLVRDQWGVEDGLDTDERPISLSPTHQYNLLNQGWAGDDPDSTVSYFENFKINSTTGKYPSNADLVFLGKRASEENVFTPILIVRDFKGTTPAAKGFFIIDLFSRSESRGLVVTNTGLLNNIGSDTIIVDGIPIVVDDIGWEFGGATTGSVGVFGDINSIDASGVNTPFPGLTTDITTSGPTVTASYAQRIFYGGLKSERTGGDSKTPLLGSLVFFTQLVDGTDKIGKCYQESDPTDEDQSDLVATDGGFVSIPEMAICLRLIPFSDSLVVFAENGIWEIKGNDAGFTATDFQVVKITDIGAVNSESIVSVEDRIYFWSKAGIYAITRDQVSLGLQINSISETTIQTLYETFSNVSKGNSTGVYDNITKQVRWMLNTETSYDGLVERFRYNTELVYDVVLDAFYISKLPDTADNAAPYLASQLLSPGFITGSISNNIVIGNDNVVIGVDQVVISQNVRVGDNSKVLYLTINPNSVSANFTYTFSNYRDADFEDWTTQLVTGIDANAFLLTGFETGGDSQRRKQATYITNSFLRTETGFVDTGGGNLEAIGGSSCFVQSQWDFANSAASGKFGPKFQAYRLNRLFTPSGTTDTFDYGQVVVTTKNKLRGRGRALSLLFETEPKKDLIMLGWGIIFGVNTNV